MRKRKQKSTSNSLFIYTNNDNNNNKIKYLPKDCLILCTFIYAGCKERQKIQKWKWWQQQVRWQTEKESETEKEWRKKKWANKCKAYSKTIATHKVILLSPGYCHFPFLRFFLSDFASLVHQTAFSVVIFFVFHIFFSLSCHK